LENVPRVPHGVPSGWELSALGDRETSRVAGQRRQRRDILHFRRCSVPQLSSDRTDGLRTSVPEPYVFFFGTFDCKYLFSFRFYSPFTSRCLSNNSSVRLRIMFGALGAQGWLFFLLFRSS
jgi:hypothetical protein